MLTFKTLDDVPANVQDLPERLVPFIWFFVRQFKAQFLVILLLFMLSNILVAVTPYFMKLVVDGMLIIEAPEQFWPVLGPAIFWFVLLILLLQPVSAQAGNYTQAKTMSVFTNSVRRQLANFVHDHSYGYFQDDFSGRLGGKVVETPSALRDVVQIAIGAFFYGFLCLIVAIVLFAAVGWIYAILTFAWLLAYMALMAFFVPQLQRLSKTASDERSYVRGRFVDSLSNILSVKLFARKMHEDVYLTEKLQATALGFQKVDLKLWRLWVWLEVQTVAFWAAALGLALYDWSQGSISLGDLAMILPLTLQLTNVAWWLSEIFANFFNRLGEIQEGMDAIIAPHTVVDAENAQPLRVNNADIHFDQVDFSYGSLPVFQGLNLTIPAGQKVGLIGPSGAGKSSLVQILLRLYDVRSGRIMVDGQVIQDVQQDSLRESIAVIPQMTDLLHRSIRDNILYGRLDADEGDVIAAAKKAHAHEFIQRLEDRDGNQNYDALVGERGIKLSGGQRQRLAIARAILKDAPILVLDEATSALDSESEQLIQSSLRDLMYNKTVLAIAHRLSTIASLDRLIVMDQGQIIEDGSHDELLAKNGYYARLWSMQSGGFLLSSGIDK